MKSNKRGEGEGREKNRRGETGEERGKVKREARRGERKKMRGGKRAAGRLKNEPQSHAPEIL
jgi:hypothetical protein